MVVKVAMRRLSAAIKVLSGQYIATPTSAANTCLARNDLEKRLKRVEDQLISVEQRLEVADAPRLATVPSLFNFFVSMFLVLLLTGVFLLRDTKDLAEYFSYVMPVLAALIGGAGLYFTRVERVAVWMGFKVPLKYDAICYALSVLFLIVGVCCFLIYKERLAVAGMAVVVPLALIHAGTGLWVQVGSKSKSRFAFWFWIFLTITLAVTSFYWIGWIADAFGLVPDGSSRSP
ncbi:MULTISPECIES: hypothetical protein [unclassified Xanthomonas]|uniref:hypothetical protein n=1 Tax=unclassified Xanthomonas TaxID=2643310 RepID=UPI002882D839|nr:MULTISPECIES: hypothetical protein [unclassified Xanthomonas]